MSWSRAFHVPIPLPDGRMLRTLRDAGDYIQALPGAKHKRPEWQVAAEMVLAAVEGSGPLMFAEIAMRKAVNAWHPVERSERNVSIDNIAMIARGLQIESWHLLKGLLNSLRRADRNSGKSGHGDWVSRS